MSDITHEDYCDRPHTAEECLAEQEAAHRYLDRGMPVLEPRD